MSAHNTESEINRLQESQQYWDQLAPTFDDEPDHSLGTSLVLETWTQLLKAWIPQANASILDIGCGTGSLSVVLAGLGHQVTGIDLSPSMISLAQLKAAKSQLQIEFYVMDAVYPKLHPQQFDVIICRHLLWALPEPKEVLQRWSKFLKQKGRFLLIEGYWSTGAGLPADDIIEILRPSSTNISVQNLSHNPNFWGKEVSDERYAIVAEINSQP
jgi:2-polyprenyl-3-methyl-5-hydroxy-6-metoxy-1,4-benzoquinol methylase